MTTDFRALCAELTDVLDGLFEDPEIPGEIRRSHSLEEYLTRARAALADEPVAGKPASVVGEPTQRQLMMLADGMNLPSVGDAANYARAVLARWGNRQGSLDSSAPQPPAEGEVAELVAWLREQAEHELGSTFDADYFSEDPAARNLNRAAELLQRLSPPQPVPVSEGWPEFSDCDDTDRVWCWNWAIGAWRLNRINRSIHSHWLPAHALPVPGQEAER